MFHIFLVRVFGNVQEFALLRYFSSMFLSTLLWHTHPAPHHFHCGVQNSTSVCSYVCVCEWLTTIMHFAKFHPYDLYNDSLYISCVCVFYNNIDKLQQYFRLRPHHNYCGTLGFDWFIIICCLLLLTIFVFFSVPLIREGRDWRSAYRLAPHTYCIYKL